MSWNIQVASVSAPSVQIGDFHISTEPITGALLSTPVSAPAQAPAPVALPSSLVLDASGIQIVPTAEFGGKVLLQDLLNELLQCEIEIPAYGIKMPVLSLASRLLARLGGVEAAVADISDNKLPALTAVDAVLQATNAAQDASIAAAAAAAAQAALDAAANAAALVLNDLSDSAVAASVSALSGRVDALEAVPAVDVSGALAPILSRLDADEAAIATKAAAADLTALDGRVTTAEADIAGKASAADMSAAQNRLDAIESALPTKVAQADYDVYVASNDAAVAAAQSAAGAAASAAAAADAKASGKPDLGAPLEVAIVDLVSWGGEAISGGVVWQAISQKTMDKLIVLRNSGAPADTIPVVGMAASTAGQVFHIHAEQPAAFRMAGASEDFYAMAAGETYSFKADGAGGWAPYPGVC